MEMSALGFGIGAAIGMVGIYLLVKIFVPTYLDTTMEKWGRIIACVLVLVVCVFLGGYIFRTEIRMGDYSKKSCSSEGCTNSPVCKFYLLGTDYFCIDHTGIAYDYFEPENYVPTVDRAGMNSKDAWNAALSIVSKKLNLADNAQFCSQSKASTIYRNPYWIVRGDVVAYDDGGKPEYIYFKVEFAFTGGDECYVRTFDYDN